MLKHLDICNRPTRDLFPGRSRSVLATGVGLLVNTRSQREVVSAMVPKRLFNIRNQYNASDSDEKLSLLKQLDGKRFTTAKDLKLLHSALRFIRAFPDSLEHHRLAHVGLTRMEYRVDALTGAERSKLRDSGIVGTPVHYGFSYEVATWLVRRAPGSVSIDWEDTHDPPGLDEILTHLLQPSEDEFFDSGMISGREWVELACSNTEGTAFDWLLAQLGKQQFASFWAQLYDAADLWLTWDLRGASLSKSLNTFPVKKVCLRRQGMRKPTGSIKKEIMRPLESMSRLPPRAGSKMIDVAMASLAVRHRETYHFNHASPHDVYLADVGAACVRATCTDRRSCGARKLVHGCQAFNARIIARKRWRLRSRICAASRSAGYVSLGSSQSVPSRRIRIRQYRDIYSLDVRVSRLAACSGPDRNRG